MAHINDSDVTRPSRALIVAALYREGRRDDWLHDLSDGLKWLRYMVASQQYREAVDASARQHPAGRGRS